MSSSKFWKGVILGAIAGAKHIHTLAEAYGATLQQLFEHHSILAVFTCRYPDWGDGTRYRGVTEDVVR